MYIEGDVPFVTNGNNNSGFGGSGDGWWGIILLALLFGGRGFGGFGGGFSGGGSSELLGYELGKVATTNDVASGFSTSTIMSNINDLKLGQSQMQNFINQGFAGLNTTFIQGTNSINNAICTLGYQNQAGFNALSHQLSDCCCQTQRAIDGINYNMATNTCNIIQAINGGNQRLLDYMQTEKINALTAENVALKGQISNSRQTNEIVSQLRDGCPIPAYLTCNPKAPYPYAYNNGQCCGGVSIQ